jgi:hypothetical protein
MRAQQREVKGLYRLVRDEAVCFVKPFERRRCESWFDLARVVTAKEELTGLKSNTHVGLCSA